MSVFIVACLYVFVVCDLKSLLECSLKSETCYLIKWNKPRIFFYFRNRACWVSSSVGNLLTKSFFLVVRPVSKNIDLYFAMNSASVIFTVVILLKQYS